MRFLSTLSFAYWNNWTQSNEFTFIDLQFREDKDTRGFSFGLLGFGIVMTWAYEMS